MWDMTTVRREIVVDVARVFERHKDARGGSEPLVKNPEDSLLVNHLLGGFGVAARWVGAAPNPHEPAAFAFDVDPDGAKVKI